MNNIYFDNYAFPVAAYGRTRIRPVCERTDGFWRVGTMNAKELKRLRRSDLLEMLLKLRKENNQLRQELEQLQEKLESRELAVQEAGTLADAAAKVSGIFEAAQTACDLYSQNMQKRWEEQQELCLKLERSTKMKCDQMLLDAAMKADAIRNAPKASASNQRAKKSNRRKHKK